MASLTELRIRDYWMVVRWFVLSLIVGLLLVLAYSDSWYLADAIHKLGDALMIAGIVGIVVELSSLGRLIEHIGTQVAERTTARHLPNPVREQIWEIVNSRLVYDAYERRYAFSHRDDGRIDVHSRITYRVRNYGFASSAYAPTCAEESFYDPQFLSLEYALTSGEGHAFNQEQLSTFTKQRPLTKAICVDDLPKLALHPMSEIPDEACTVTWHYRMIRNVEDSDITSFGGPTIDPVFDLQSPPDMHSFSDGEKVSHLEGGTRWIFKRPFIRDQHARVWWFKKKKDGAPAA